jgi:hypothetical protein
MMPFAFGGTVPLPGVAEQKAMLPWMETPFEVQFQYAITFPTSPPLLLQLKVHVYVDCPKAVGMIDSAARERTMIPQIGKFLLRNLVPNLLFETQYLSLHLSRIF